MEKRREISTREIFILCLGDAGRAFIYGIIASFLLIFYVPSESSIAKGEKITYFLPLAGLAIGIIKAIGVIWDAISDPIIANKTDKFEHKLGKRIPFMRVAFIPYAVCALLVFFTPINHESWFNVVWVGVMLLAFYTFSTLYYIPYSALQVEVVKDPKRRVFFFTINSLLYVVSSAVCYSVFMIKGALANAGIDYAWSYRIPFIAFALIGAVMLAIPAFFIKEKELVDESEPCHVPLKQSLKVAFKNKNFVVLVFAYLVMWIGLQFFNSSLAYYITTLLGQEEGVATIVLAISIVVGIVTYPLINKLVAKFGKKPLLIAAVSAYALLFGLVYLYKVVLLVLPPMVFAILLGLLIAMPISITNILPISCFGDIATYDSLKTGESRAGMFLASKNFATKLSDAIVVILVSQTIIIGSADGKTATAQGVQLTALIAAIASIVAIILYSLYNDKTMIKEINEMTERKEENHESN